MTATEWDATVKAAFDVLGDQAFDLTDDELTEERMHALPAGTELVGPKGTLTVLPGGLVQHGINRWTFASALYFYGPLRATHGSPCHVCGGGGSVGRIRGGVSFVDPCPRCVEHSAEWGWEL